jgi:hypothetical protein
LAIFLPRWLYSALLVGLGVAAGCNEDRNRSAPTEPQRAACAPATSGAESCTEGAASPKPLPVKEASAFCKEACDDAGRSFDESKVVPLTHAKVGDLTRCPVSGAVFRISADTPRVEHSGRTHFVCCDGCASKFRESPARFSGG